MRQLRTLAVLLVVFIGLVAAVALQQRQLDEADPVIPTPAFQRVFPELAASEIRAMRLENPRTEETLTFIRDPEGIWVAPETSGILDQTTAGDIAATLVLLPYRDSFAIGEETDLAQYGFVPTPEFLIQIVTVDDVQHAVAVGSRSVNEETLYALVDDRQEIYLVQWEPVEFLLQNFMNPPIN
jgi:hypothetical protein